MNISFLSSLLHFLILLWIHIQTKNRLEERAIALFQEWRKDELDQEASRKASLLFEEWRHKEERETRKDAIGKSEAVIRGKVTEHIIPFLPAFPFSPKDARFLGNPVYFIVIDGLSEGRARQVVLVEVKTGKSAALTPWERTIKECVEKKNVAYQLIHHEPRV